MFLQWQTGDLLIIFVSGFSAGLLYTPPVVIIYDYFDKYKSLASGIALTGHAIGALTSGPLCRVLIDYYGWRGAMMMLAGLSLHGCVAAMIMAPFEHNKHPTKPKWNQSFNLELLKDPYFHVYVWCINFEHMQASLVYMFAPSRAVDKGMVFDYCMTKILIKLN